MANGQRGKSPTLKYPYIKQCGTKLEALHNIHSEWRQTTDWQPQTAPLMPFACGWLYNIRWTKLATPRRPASCRRTRKNSVTELPGSCSGSPLKAGSGSPHKPGVPETAERCKAWVDSGANSDAGDSDTFDHPLKERKVTVPHPINFLFL